MIDLDNARRLEEASLNAWPSLNSLIYDGWLLRFAKSYTKRANSITPLAAGSLDLERKIAYCEAVYKKQHLPAAFRLTSLVESQALEQRLAARGYDLKDPTSVQQLALSESEGEFSKRATILPGRDGISSWLRSFHELNPYRMDAETHEQILYRILGQTCPLVLLVDGEVVACGLGVVEDQYLGIFDIVTAAEHRRLGYGREITESLLAWGRDMGAEYAYLQVMKDNAPATRLYASLGFRELYHYRYRVSKSKDNL